MSHPKDEDYVIEFKLQCWEQDKGGFTGKTMSEEMTIYAWLISYRYLYWFMYGSI